MQYSLTVCEDEILHGFVINGLGLRRCSATIENPPAVPQAAVAAWSIRQGSAHRSIGRIVYWARNIADA